MLLGYKHLYGYYVCNYVLLRVYGSFVNVVNLFCMKIISISAE